MVDIRPESAPALGDLRRLGAGDTIFVFAGATQRPDWGRIQDAIGSAVARGANVTHLEDE
mgnify:CR=1 FL=1